MNLVFIHGIAQQDHSAAELLDRWSGLLVENGLDPGSLDAAHARMAYYGDALYAWTNANSAISMGPSAADPEFAFIAGALDEIARTRGLEDDAIETFAGQYAATPQSTWAGRRAVAIASMLERLSPCHGRIAIQVIRQAYIYLAIRQARKEIDDLVRPFIQSGEMVIVSHSLGTVVAFSLLRDLAAKGADIKVPLFVTLGSPLAIAVVQRRLAGPFAVPGNVGTWMNFFDTGDPVTLGRPLAVDFAKGVSDTVVNNNTQNGHSIEGYLNHQELVGPLNAVLKSAP